MSGSLFEGWRDFVILASLLALVKLAVDERRRGSVVVAAVAKLAREDEEADPPDP